jgi:hypothetical protein
MRYLEGGIGNTDGMVLTATNKVIGEKLAPVPIFHHKF